MKRKEKRIQRIQNAKGEIAFNDVQFLLGQYGFCLKSIRGSHYKFVARNGEKEVIPVHNSKVRKEYIKKIIKKYEVKST